MKTLKQPLLEKLAELEHKQWGYWMTFLKSISKTRSGEVCQNSLRWTQWKKLVNTDYKDLTEQQKESDREYARKVLAIFREMLEQEETDDLLGEKTASEFKQELLQELKSGEVKKQNGD